MDYEYTEIPLKISVSAKYSRKNPKIFTYDYETKNIDDLGLLLHLANRFSLSAPTYKDGHRAGKNVTDGGTFILIDCDEEGMSDLIESKIAHYDYVKVPSASFKEKPYKYHYFLPTQAKTSIYKAGLKWQYEQFFKQVGIKPEMIDMSGVDVARQFAPARIGFDVDEADDESDINETGLRVPIMQAPQELNNPSATLSRLNINAEIVDDLPDGHVWYEGMAISENEAYEEILKADGNVSGFGCPHDNYEHSSDRRYGYGFGVKNKDGQPMIKCVGNCCSTSPYYSLHRTIELEEIDLSVNNEYIQSDEFVESFKVKWDGFGNVSSPELEQTWKNNSLAMNKCIEDNQQGKINKYVVSAVTGSAKTENIISFTAQLDEIGVLIVTNLREEADRLAHDINVEAGKDKAVSFHSAYSSDKKPAKNYPFETDIEKAITFQIIIVTHEFYRRNYMGTDRWDTVVADRDLIAIDEALDTIVSVSIDAGDISNIIQIGNVLKTYKKYKSDKEIQIALDWLENKDYQLLNKDSISALGNGTKLLHSEKSDLRKMYNEITDEDIEIMKGRYNKLITVFLTDKSIQPTRIIMRYQNDALDEIMRERLANKLDILQKMTNTQLYTTSNRGTRSFHSVSDEVPNKSIVCFDATSNVTETYKLRAKYHEDLKLIPKVDGVRNYQNVKINTAQSRTGQEAFKKSDNVKVILSSVEFGKKTLIVTHKANKGQFMDIIASNDELKDKEIDIAHWGALTGLNTWNDYDTCVIAGLNHKPIHYSQDRAIINTNEDTAFSNEEQGELNNRISQTNLISEIIQAINRIRVRKTIDSDGNCDSANIYITLPSYNNSFYLKHLKDEMPNAKFSNWSFDGAITLSESNEGHLPSIIAYLEGNLNGLDEISIYRPREDLHIAKDSYSRIIGRKAFEQRLNDFGFQIIKKKAFTTRGKEKKTMDKYIKLM